MCICVNVNVNVVCINADYYLRVVLLPLRKVKAEENEAAHSPFV